MPPNLPPANDDPEPKTPADMMDSDQDAEGEEETDLYQMDQQLQDAVHRAFTGEAAEDAATDDPGDDQDAEGEPDTELILDGDQNDAEPVGAVKLPENGSAVDDEEAASGAADADADPAFDNQSDSDQEASRSSSSSQESDDEEWEGESNDHEDAEAETLVRGNCM